MTTRDKILQIIFDASLTKERGITAPEIIETGIPKNTVYDAIRGLKDEGLIESPGKVGSRTKSPEKWTITQAGMTARMGGSVVDVGNMMEVCISAGRLFWQGGDHSFAGKWLKMGLQTAGRGFKRKKSEIYVLLGNIEDDNGRFAESVKMYEKATALDPSNARAWGNMAYAYLEQGELERAEELYDKALELGLDADGEAVVWVGKAIVAARGDDTKECRKYITSALNCECSEDYKAIIEASVLRVDAIGLERGGMNDAAIMAWGLCGEKFLKLGLMPQVGICEREIGRLKSLVEQEGEGQI